MINEFISKRDIALLVGSTLLFSAVALFAWFSPTEASLPSDRELRSRQIEIGLVGTDEPK